MLIRDPQNPHDPNAVKVEVDGQLVGFIAKEMASSLGPFMDSVGCPRFGVAGVIRGGSDRAPTFGVHIWPARRITPGPGILIEDEDAEPYEVEWPPSGPRGSKSGGPVDRYFALRVEISNAWDSRDFSTVIRASRETMDLMDDVVREVLNSDGAFWTSLPPAIAHGGSCLALYGDRDGLQAMRATVAGNQALLQWLPDVDKAISDEELTRSVLGRVREQPGCLQKDIYKVLGEEKERVAHVCWMASEAGVLIRTKSGTSYSLTMGEPD